MAKRNTTSGGRRRQRQKSLTTQAKADLKAFRKAVATLKRLGIAFSRTAPRKASPSSRSKKTVTNFADILSGKKVVRKAGPKAKEFKEAGYQVEKGKLILPAEKNVRYMTRQGKLYRIKYNDAGDKLYTSQQIPLHYTRMVDYLENLRNNPALEGTLSKDKVWAFRFFGNDSIVKFNHLDLMADYLLERYTAVQQALVATRKKQEEVIQGIEIIQVHRNAVRNVDREDAGGGYKSYKKRWGHSAERYQRMKERDPEKYQRQLERKRQQATERYAGGKWDLEFRANKARLERARYARMKAQSKT